MAKAKIYDKTGKTSKEGELPKNFNVKIREDILAKAFDAEKGLHMQAYGAKEGAGAQYSASGISKKKRHDWKGTYGKGISRVPRKIMSRHGASFNWIGATVSSTRGGRRPHAPRSIKNLFKKINKKERVLAYNSAFTATIDKGAIQKRYGKEIPSGIIIQSSLLTSKTKEFMDFLKKVFTKDVDSVIKVRSIRAGKGKMRGRKYKSNAGLLLVIGSQEKTRRKGIDVAKVQDITLKDLAPNGEPGRITMYTEVAVKEIGEQFK